MDDYDSYNFWLTGFSSVHFIKKTEIFPTHWIISEQAVRKNSIGAGLGNLFKKSE